MAISFEYSLLWWFGLSLCASVVQGDPATVDFLPPLLPEEYSLSFEETYDANSYDSGNVFVKQRTVGTQYWSLARQAQRAIVSSGIGGISSGSISTPAVNSLTVTNFTDPDWDKGSLVADLINQECNYYANEGGTSYQGYDFFRNFVLGALTAGVPVEQTNVTDWIHNNISYGPVHIWSGTPPTGIEGRVLTYTIVFPQDSNYLLSYQVNGTEDLPNEITGEPEYVSMRSVNMRFNYAETAIDDWPEEFFDVINACPFHSATETTTAPASLDETLESVPRCPQSETPDSRSPSSNFIVLTAVPLATCLLVGFLQLWDIIAS